MSEQEQAGRQDQHKKSKSTNSLYKVAKRILIGLILLWVTIIILIQIPFIQNYAISRISNSLSERTGTKITVDKFEFQLFDAITLGGVYVEDYDQDTLLYAERFKLNFQNPIYTYLRNRMFKIDGLTLSNSKFNLDRNPGDSMTNIERFFSHFSKRDTIVTRDQEEFVFELELDEIILRNTQFQRTDSLLGVQENYHVYQALLNPEEIDFKNKSFVIENAVIDSLTLQVNNFVVSDIDSTILSGQEEKRTGGPSKPLLLKVKELDISRSQFELHNYVKSPIRTSAMDVLDWNHLTLGDIDINISDFQFDDWRFTGCLNHLDGITESGFEIKNFNTDLVYVDSSGLSIENAHLETPYSNWAANIKMDYERFQDFKSYTDMVEMHVNSKEGEIAIEDIITFAPGLKKVRFFDENRMEKIVINGRFNGTVNNLSGDDLLLQIGDLTYLEGYFSSRNLAHPENTLLNLEIESSRTQMRELRKLIPGFRPPSNFNRLGQIRFQGRFDGFYQDFVAFGSMRSGIGRAEMDMRMNLNDEMSKAEYSGQLNLFNFDLGQWTGNQDFGLVDFNAFVTQGKGLTLGELDASLQATIRELTYKNYTYTNFTVDGQFRQAAFEGYFNIEDENVDFSFIGKVDLDEELPIIDVNADIQNINFQKLNITETKYLLSGNVDLAISNYNLNQLQAEVLLDSIKLVQNDSITYTLDSLYARSDYISEQQKSIEIQGGLLDANISGVFNIEKIWPALQSEIINYYPSFTQKLGWKRDSLIASNQNFEASVKVHRSGNWPQLFLPKLDSFSNTKLNLAWNNAADSFKLDGYIPRLHYGQHKFFDGYLYVRSYQGNSNIVVGADSALIQDRFNLKATTVFSDISSDTLFWTLNTANYADTLDNLNIQGKTYIRDDHWTSSLADEYLQLFNENWYISPNNFVQIDSHYLNIEHFSLQNEDRRIRLESINDQGIAVNLEGVQLSLLNDILAYDKLKYAGRLTASVSKSNIFNNSALAGEVRVDSLYINGDGFGKLDLNVEAPGARSVLTLQGSIADSLKKLEFNGQLFAYNSGLTEDFYDVNIQMVQYPLAILEYFIGDNITDTEGELSGDFHLVGELEQPVLNGEALLTNGAVTIDFLGTRVYIDSQMVYTARNEIDVTGAIIQDKYGNSAELKGGLVHNYFRDLGLDFRLVTENFLLLNTSSENDARYYGHCLGSAQIDMFGDINSPNINIVAENNPNTQFYLRTDETGEEVQAGYFRYENLKDTVQIVERTLDAPKGVNFSLDLTANESAEVHIIIDQSTGDIIKGRGKGEIQFFLNPAGEINMFGNYVISTGEYLFTAQTLINKTFRVSSGSVIRWTGDPLAAIIDIEATYDVVTSPLFFVDDLVVEDPQLISALQDPTEVILIVNLKGALYSPELGFDLRFPNLTGTAETVVENKLALLEGNPSEMYDHAGALIVFNSFVPSASGAGGNIGSGALANTISEFLSNQFSRLFSSLLRSAVADVGFIDEIDFNVKYDVRNRTADLQPDQETYAVEGGEFKMRTSARLFERVELDLGGNYGVGTSTLGATESGTYFTGNFAIQYALTEDRQLVLRVYSATDRVLEGRRFRSGVGIRYQQEFDSFPNFFEGLKNAIQKGSNMN